MLCAIRAQQIKQKPAAMAGFLFSSASSPSIEHDQGTELRDRVPVLAKVYGEWLRYAVSSQDLAATRIRRYAARS